jgi:predicted nucleic acid-binding protein
MPIDATEPTPADTLELPTLALRYRLTNYDAAYLRLAIKFSVPLATTDELLREAAVSAGVNLVVP